MAKPYVMAKAVDDVRRGAKQGRGPAYGCLGMGFHGSHWHRIFWGHHLLTYLLTYLLTTRYTNGFLCPHRILQMLVAHWLQ